MTATTDIFTFFKESQSGGSGCNACKKANTAKRLLKPEKSFKAKAMQAGVKKSSNNCMTKKANILALLTGSPADQ